MLKRAVQALLARLRRREEKREPDLAQMRVAIHNHRAQAGGPDES